MTIFLLCICYVRFSCNNVKYLATIINFIDYETNFAFVFLYVRRNDEIQAVRDLVPTTVDEKVMKAKMENKVCL